MRYSSLKVKFAANFFLNLYTKRTRKPITAQSLSGFSNSKQRRAQVRKDSSVFQVQAALPYFRCPNYRIICFVFNLFFFFSGARFYFRFSESMTLAFVENTTPPATARSAQAEGQQLLTGTTLVSASEIPKRRHSHGLSRRRGAMIARLEETVAFLLVAACLAVRPSWSEAKDNYVSQLSLSLVRCLQRLCGFSLES